MPPNAAVDIDVRARLDITRDRCPMTFVRVRLALDRLGPGDVLLVTLRGEEPRKNVPATATSQGHLVLALESGADDTCLLWIKKQSPI